MPFIPFCLLLPGQVTPFWIPFPGFVPLATFVDHQLLVCIYTTSYNYLSIVQRHLVVNLVSFNQAQLRPVLHNLPNKSKSGPFDES